MSLSLRIIFKTAFLLVELSKNLKEKQQSFIFEIQEAENLSSQGWKVLLFINTSLLFRFEGS